MKFLCLAFMAIVLLGQVTSAQVDSAYTIKNGTVCNGQNPTGAWDNPSTWSSSGGLSRPPVGNWSGTKIVIQNDIIICNNDGIDLSGSSLNTIIMKSGSSITYKANSTLSLPPGTTLIMEPNTTISVSNESQGTLLQIGNDSIWGKEVLCTIDITGPRTITSLSRICEESLLPVELAHFEAKEIERRINLEWVTLSESNSSLFEIYRSKDAIEWESIGEVKAAGWSKKLIKYNWMDEHPPYSLNYYKIKQFDLDGSYDWFPIVSAKLDNSLKAVINNPIDNILYLSLSTQTNLIENEMVKVLLFDANGTQKYSTLITVEGNRNSYALDLSELNEGIYYLFLESSNVYGFIDKIVKM